METKFKNVLITGASSGIGEAMALYYAASGSENLFICGRNKERLNEVCLLYKSPSPRDRRRSRMTYSG